MVNIMLKYIATFLDECDRVLRVQVEADDESQAVLKAERIAIVLGLVQVGLAVA